MYMIKFLLPLLLFLVGMLSDVAHAQQRKHIDRVVAVINSRIILKSDVDQQVRSLVQIQQMPYSKELWTDVLESVIDNYVLIEKAKIDSIEVSNAEVDRELDRRIQGQVQQYGSESALEEAYGMPLIQVRAKFRDQFRDELLAQKVRQKKMNEIKITRPEVDEFFAEIPRDSLPTIPESVELAQIVSIAPAAKDAREQAYKKAAMIRDSLLNQGVNFEEMAKRYSEGPSGPDGGLLPLMPMSDLVSEYSAAASALQPGQISEIVETSFGLHVIRLNKRVGDKIESNHILIQLDSEQVDEQVAIDKLEAIRDTLLTNPERSFTEMARFHSEDPLSAPAGGRLFNQQTGQRLLAMNQLDPALYRIVLLLQEGEISDPKPFRTQGAVQKKAFRIVKLIKIVPEHVASLDQDYDLIKRFANQEKQVRVLNKWLSELRDRVYVEYKIQPLNN